MARKRHVSRIAVMQSLFEWGVRGTTDPVVTLERYAADLGEMDVEFAHVLLQGILDSVDALIARIESCAPGWTFERMDPVSRSVLLIGAHELTANCEVPAAVVMDEAIEIAKEYCSDEAGKFVNGVLNALAKHVPTPPTA